MPPPTLSGGSHACSAAHLTGGPDSPRQGVRIPQVDLYEGQAPGLVRHDDIELFGDLQVLVGLQHVPHAAPHYKASLQELPGKGAQKHAREEQSEHSI